MSEKLVTADVVEIVDSKMHAMSSHPAITVVSGDTYDTVLSKVEVFAVTAAQRQAMEATLSSASTLNPIVLKDDIPAIYGSDDLGSIKDSVPTFADLPLTGNALNDMRPVTADNIVYRWNATSWVPFITTGTMDHTQLINFNSDLLTNPSSATPGLYRHLARSEKSLLLNPTQNHNHTNFTQLETITDAGSGIIIKPAERTNMPSADESAAMQYSVQVLPPNIDLSDVINVTAHGFLLNDKVKFFCSNGTLPTPLLPSTSYYVVNPTINSFQISTSLGGIPVHFSTPGTRMFLALRVTSLSPSGSNRIVSNVDPRLNTIRNPYITFGPNLATPPLPSFFGQDITDLIGSIVPLKEGAIPAILKAVGTAWAVKSLEILPNTTISPLAPDPYTLNDGLKSSPITISPDVTWTFAPTDVNTASDTITVVGHAFHTGQIVTVVTTGSAPGGVVSGKCYGVNVLTSNTVQLYSDGGPALLDYVLGEDHFRIVDITSQGSGTHTLVPLNVLLMESLALRNVTFSMQTGTACVRVEDGSGAVTIEGIVFEVQDTNTYCVDIWRDGVIFEECEFRTKAGEFLTMNHNGPYVFADGVTFRRCSFGGTMVYGLTVVGDNCRIEDCSFSLGTPILQSTIEITGNQCQLDHCIFSSSGNMLIHIVGDNCQISSNQLPLSSVSILDQGSNSRILTNLPQQQNQPFHGSTKTIGPAGSYADYRGNDEQPFVDAFADPLCNELVVLTGSYVFTASITVPSGKTVMAATSVAPAINGILYPTSNNAFHGLSFVSSGAVLTDANYVNFTGCSFNATSGYSLWLRGSNVSVDRCTFVGLGGFCLQTSDDWWVTNSVFQTSGSPLMFTDAHYGRVEGNVFLSGLPLLSVNNSILRGNYFANVPSKLLTLNSPWVGNIPPAANNVMGGPTPAGIDEIKINLESMLEPVDGTGAALDVTSGVASVAYAKAGEGMAVTLPTPINAFIPAATPYTVDLNWTSPVFSGTVVWEATCTFRDRVAGTTGTPVVFTVNSARTKFSPRSEDACSVSGITYGGITTPTHVSVKIRRLSTNPSDSFHGTAHLTGASITFSQRD